MKNVLLIALLFAGFTACQNDASKQNQSNTSTPVTTETPAAVESDTMITLHGNTYACPMHPEVTSAKAGDKCSKCGMALVQPEKK